MRPLGLIHYMSHGAPSHSRRPRDAGVHLFPGDWGQATLGCVGALLGTPSQPDPQSLCHSSIPTKTASLKSTRPGGMYDKGQREGKILQQRNSSKVQNFPFAKSPVWTPHPHPHLFPSTWSCGLDAWSLLCPSASTRFLVVLCSGQSACRTH